MAPKPPAYSWSALEMFFGGPTHGGCPLAYRLVRQDKIPRADTEPLIIGRDCHKLAADYLTSLVKTGQATDWDGAGVMLTPSTHPDVAEIFTRFYENFILPPIESPGIEKQIAFNRAWQPVEWFAKDAFFRMILDFTFMQGGLAVVKDFKTNRKIIEVDPENIPLQLKIYAWGGLKAIFPGAQEVLLQLDFMRYGVQREILLTPSDLDGVPAELEAKIAVIEAEKYWDPRPGSYCSWCGVQSHCPVMEKALVVREVVYPASYQDAVKAAQVLLAIRQMSSIITANLKNWSQQSGPVKVGDMVYGPIPEVEYSLDPQSVTDQLLGMDFPRDDVWKVLKVGKMSLDAGLKKMGLIGKRAKERKALVEEILAAADSQELVSYDFKKAK